MPTYPVIDIVNCEPVFGKPHSKETISIEKILDDVKFGGALKTLTPLEHITERQRRWYKGICLRDLVKNDENGETKAWWDLEVKSKCNGLAYLKKEGLDFELKLGDEITRVTIGRLTTKNVGRRNMSLFMEEIISQSMTRGWNITAPDPELRTK